MIAVDELAREDGKTGADWYFARAANTFIFRPNETCLINHMDDTLRMGIRREERRADKQRGEIAQDHKRFTALVKKNASAHDIRHVAKIISVREIGLRRTLTILENFIVANQELQETKGRKTEQQVMTGLSNVYANFLRRAIKQGAQRKTIKYEMNRDTIADMHELYHEAWRSGPEFQGEEEDTDALVRRMIDAKGLDLPDVMKPDKMKEKPEKRQAESIASTNMNTNNTTTLPVGEDDDLYARFARLQH